MLKTQIKEYLKSFNHISFLIYVIKWLLICLLLGILTGSISSLFLKSLELVTDFRESNIWIIAFLPVGGFIIGLSYYLFGDSVVKGNNLVIEEINSPKKIIPFKMAPLVLFGTILTHLIGGSVGREGTAVQVGGAIADNISKIFKLSRRDRRILLIAGISAGFASIFGTPIAGGIFALEVLTVGRIKSDAILPSFFAAVFANYFCEIWKLVDHTHYHIPNVVEMTPSNLVWSVIAGILFGLAAMIFSKSSHYFGHLFKKIIKYPPLRPTIGGLILAIVVYSTSAYKYIGLGIPTIIDSFEVNLNSYDFLVKILFTAFTIGAGFKGGEVTPLFFIGATLGNVLVWFIPLPMPLLAGMGFVAVFAGATNTPIACIMMGIELFGDEPGVFIAIACSTAYLFSGHTGVYTSQIIGSAKHKNLKHQKGVMLSEIDKKKKTS